MHECIHAWPLIPKVLLLCLIHALIRSLARSLAHSLTRYLSCLLAGLVVRAVCSHFLENADFPNGGMADWGTGMGQLEVYLDEMSDPVLVAHRLMLHEVLGVERTPYPNLGPGANPGLTPTLPLTLTRP